MEYIFPPFFVLGVLPTVIMQPTLEKNRRTFNQGNILVLLHFLYLSPTPPPPKKTQNDICPYPVIPAPCKQGKMIQYTVNEMLLLLDRLNSMNAVSPAPHVTLFTEHRQ